MADLHDTLTHQFNKLMGSGIYSAEEQRQLAFWFHKGAYEDHLRSEQTYKSKDRISNGRAMTPVPSEDIEENLLKKFARKFNPIFYFLGEWCRYVFGILLLTGLVASCCGCTRRFCWKVKYVGCTPMLLTTTTKLQHTEAPSESELDWLEVQALHC